MRLGFFPFNAHAFAFVTKTICDCNQFVGIVFIVIDNQNISVIIALFAVIKVEIVKINSKADSADVVSDFFCQQVVSSSRKHGGGSFLNIAPENNAVVIVNVLSDRQVNIDFF